MSLKISSKFPLLYKYTFLRGSLICCGVNKLSIDYNNVLINDHLDQVRCLRSDKNVGVFVKTNSRIFSSLVGLLSACLRFSSVANSSSCLLTAGYLPLVWSSSSPNLCPQKAIYDCFLKFYEGSFQALQCTAGLSFCFQCQVCRRQRRMQPDYLSCEYWPKLIVHMIVNISPVLVLRSLLKIW